MNVLSELNAAQNAVDEAYHNFLLSFRQDSRVVYGFVEGQQDPSFYKGAIEAIIPPTWQCRMHQSGNRDKVLKAYRDFDWQRFDRRRVCFFLDSDLVPFTKCTSEREQNIYLTDGYSIENSILTEDVLLRMIVEVMNLAKLTEEDEQLILAAYRARLGEFHRLMEPLMALMICWRRDLTPALLSNINMNKIVSVSYQAVTGIHGANDNTRMGIAAWEARATQYSQEDLDIALDALRSSGGIANHLRGKYLAWFFVQFLISVHANAPLFALYSSPPKIGITLSEGSLMALAGPRARPSPSIRLFIERNYVNYVNHFEARRQA